MLKNYFKIAIRNLVKYRTYSFINIFGLTAGITCFLLIALYIFDELTFDRLHIKADRIYRIVENRTSAEGNPSRFAGAGYQVSSRAVTDIPGIQSAVRVATFNRTNVSNPEKNTVFNENYTIASQSFFDVFDFELLQGNRQSAFAAPNSVVLTEETARKLFGSTAVLGKAVKIEGDSIPYRITGIVKNFPSNSHLSFNLLISESTLNSEEDKKFLSADWSSGDYSTYFLFNSNTSIKDIEKQLNHLITANRTITDGSKGYFTLQPLKDIHFHSGDIDGMSGKKGNITYIYIFSILALFVLFIACINYMNLATARFSNRTKEIAVRKVSGAAQIQLIVQFLSEAMLMTVISILLAVGIVQMVLPAFNRFTEKQLSLGFASDYRLWIGIAIIATGVGLLSGIYPALIQSRLKPLQLLKNKIHAGKGALSVRKILVVFQFSISIIMIVATLIVYLQLKYIDNKDMGFNKNELVVLDINSGKVRRGAETIKTEIGKLAAVKDVTITSRVPGEWKNIPKVKLTTADRPGKREDMYFIGSDEQFIKTYEMSLAQGRNFTGNKNVDSTSVLINESAARVLGITRVEEQRIEILSRSMGNNVQNLRQPYHVKVAGIIKDFNFRSLREPVAPMVIGWRQNPIHNIDYFTVKVSAGHIPQTLKAMERIVHSIDAEHIFEYNFLNTQWELFYREDEKRRSIFMAVALMTILIACMGLFGLVTFTAEQRVKEIGIRKVLGATVSGIVTLLSKDFLQLVLISSVIALPVSAWLMHNWLKDFAYRIQISWWMLAAAAVMALLIALVTISFQAIRAALMNPVKSLRSE
jgi:putative ABC transport system permease protein